MKKNLFKLTLLLLGIFTLNFSFAQSGTISGKISNTKGEGLEGVTVLITNAKGGAISDANGYYKITAAPGTYNLEFKYFGLKTNKKSVTINAGSNITLNIKLEEDASNLNEVVAIGYGTKAKIDITGSIATVKGKELTQIPTASFETGLQGKVAGLQVITGSGVAGSASLIRIRGVASVSSSGDPLYIIDGIPITQDYFIKGNGGGTNSNPLASINPLDIESVEILKDAAATAIYGARGSNGVIIITTKSAKKEGWGFEVTTKVGTAQPTYKANMLNSADYLQLYQEAWENDGNVGQAKLPNDVSWEDARKTDTDWEDEVTRLGIKRSFSLGAGYKNKKFNAFLNLSRDNNESYLINNTYIRNSVRLNLNWEPIKNLKLGFNTSYTKGINHRVPNAWDGGYGDAISRSLPIYSVRDSAGDYDLSHRNPVAWMTLKDWKNIENRSVNSIKIGYEISPKLTINSTIGFDYYNIDEDIYEPQALIPSFKHKGISKRFTNTNFTSTLNLYANYKWIDTKANKLSVMLGTERVDANNTSTSFEATNTEAAFYNNKAAMDTLQSDLTTGSPWALVSFFSRVNYRLKDKYLVDLVIRADGSSKFGPENRYGFFPAVGLGWVISEESFMKRFPRTNFLKLKFGFGITGNVPSEANAWRQVWIGSSNNVNYNGKPTVYPTNYENPNLGWDESRIIDLTLEGGAFKNKITYEIAIYNKNTIGVLSQLNVPTSLGFQKVWVNATEVLNRGVEFSITTKNISKPNFQWETQFNIARNVNRLLDLGEFKQEALGGGTNDTRLMPGEPIGTNFLVRFSHIDPSTGRPIYLDINGNETFEWDADNRVAVGSVLPKAVGGITNILRYKQFSFNLNFVYKIGGNIYNSSGKYQNGPTYKAGSGPGPWNHTTDYINRWQKDGDDSKYAKHSREISEYGLSPLNAWDNNSTLFLENASYLRMRLVSLSYTVPSEVLKEKIRDLEFGLSLSNFLTFTKYKSGDPEVARDFESPQDRNMSSNINYLTPPQEKSVMFNINFKF